MAAVTRLGYEGYGVRRAGSFAGKTLTLAGRPITRLGEGGYGVRRYSSFAGKTATADSGAGELPHHLPFFATVGAMMTK